MFFGSAIIYININKLCRKSDKLLGGKVRVGLPEGMNSEYKSLLPNRVRRGMWAHRWRQD